MINILYMGHSRTRYFDYFMKMFSGMRNRSNVRILVMIPDYNSIWTDRRNKLMSMGFQVVIEKFGGNSGNYREKLYRAFNFPSEYTIKIDEDIFCSSETIDYMIDNCKNSIDSDSFILTPLLSTGIPTVDKFINQNFSQEEVAPINDIFKKVHFGHIWGSDYSSLNSCTINASTWSSENFFNTVRNLPTCFKGIHPVRLSAEAQILIHNTAMKNIGKLNKNNLSISKCKFPYICNSFFMIRTNEWRNVLDDKSRWVDLYDEVPLNLYMQQHNKSMSIVENSFVVHPSYNTIGDLYSNISDEFYNFIMKVK